MAARRRPTTPTHPARSTGARVVADAFSPARDDRTVRITRIGIALLLVATVAFVCVVRVRLTSVPLERDEGEYAYAGQLILKNVPPYLAVYNMKFPGMYYAYAGVMAAFGQSPTAIRLGLLSVHLMSLGLLFVWGRRVVGEFAAAIGTAAFALLALDRWSMGVFFHATHLVVFFVLAALVVLQDGRRTWRLIVAGVLFGLAIVMKQQALPFAMVGIALAMRADGQERLFGRDALRRGAMVLGGIAMSLILLVAAMAAQGVLGQFWQWTIQYAAAYVSETPASMATTIFGMAWSYITQATGWWWYLGLIGVVLVLVTRWPGSTRIVLVAMLGAAGLAIVPGYFFRPHYFILAMPVIGLLVGVTFASADRVFAGAMGPARARMATLVLFAAIAGVQIVRDRHFLFDMPPTDLIRAVYQTNPFLEAPEIGRYLRAHTGAADRIAVLGSEPEVLFYADRPSATGYIYMYSLTERQPLAAGMQQELIQDVTATRPLYVVLVDAAPSWVSSLHPDTRVVTWANTFVSTCYDRVGLVDIDPAGPATILWDSAVAGYRPRFTSRVTVFRRQTTAACGVQ